MVFNEEFKKKYGFEYDESKTFLENVFSRLKAEEDKKITEFGVKFQSKLWEDAPLSLKTEYINEFSEFLSKYFKLEENPRVIIQKMQENTRGGYSKKGNIIVLNELYIRSGEEFAATLVHEMAHALQKELIDKVTIAENGFIGKIASVIVKWCPHSSPDWIKQIAIDRNVSTWVANPKLLPVTKYRMEFKINQRKLEYPKYIALVIEMNAFNTEVGFAYQMFGRMTEPQARKFADYAGEYGYGEKKEKENRQYIVIEKDSNGNALCVIEKDDEFEFFIENMQGDIVYKHPNYVDVYKQFDKFIN